MSETKWHTTFTNKQANETQKGCNLFLKKELNYIFQSVFKTENRSGVTKLHPGCEARGWEEVCA